MQRPNSHTLHVNFTMGYRMDKNISNGFAKKRPVSKFWDTLNTTPLSKRIAVAPWYFSSYDWDGPIWEKLSQQYIVPGSLLGLCTDFRKGEVPNNDKYQFKNFSYLVDKKDLIEREIDLVVYQSPNRYNQSTSTEGLDKCLPQLKLIYGQPIYHDHLITVFGVKSQ